ncbi:hypothetical protein FA13DRAFT_1787933 [Coprinellus micaceus]|uniref:HAT C-terminal dimerisation domain-containing protein n=1 Tax=Coprinellus micaceus TaxID=71717 RepID=A0A4Y7TMX1_COPMI|nr:hypothetical protein FA13DRAFT_1787933 [Coprinellus micaceus]
MADRNLTPAGLYKMAERVCSRILKEDIGPGFFTVFMDYLHKHDNYSAQWMSLDSRKEEVAEMGKEPDIIRIWESIMTGEPMSGPHQLARLAIYIQTAVANSAGCKRLFSELGLVHTKKRCRMAWERVHKSSMVHMDIKQKHEEAGVTPKQRKRKFMEFTEAGSSSGEAAEQGGGSSTSGGSGSLDDGQRAILVEEISDFGVISCAIVEDEGFPSIKEDDDLPTTLELVAARSRVPIAPATSSSPTPPMATPGVPPRQRANAKVLILLASLFIYPATDNPTPWEGVDLYWKGGLEMPRDEESLHETLTTALMTGQGLNDSMDAEIRTEGGGRGDGAVVAKADT